MKEKYDVKGMTCAACQSHVQNAVSKVNGVNKVNVNLLKNDMVVEYDEKVCSSLDIINAVKKSGYETELQGNKLNNKNNKEEKDNSLITLIISIVDLLVLMYFGMFHMMFKAPTFDAFNMMKNPMGYSLLQFILVLPIVYLNFKYFKSGFNKLFRLNPNMDSLISLGSSISIIYGIYCLFMISLGKTEYHEYLYFESAGMILVFVSLGKYLENLSKKRTTNAITKLMDLSPKTALVLVDGKEEIIPSENIKVNDIVIVKKGDVVPIDGIIIEGNGSFNESSITGESLPKDKGVNDEVISSSMLLSGYVKIKATKVGEDTTLKTIIKLVEEASSSKAPISKLVDKISLIFVPVIITISLLVFIINILINHDFELSLNFAITVLVIACPCALGLATPVSIMVGTGKGAQNGLIIKNAEILERAHLIKTIVFDKTGTITKGEPEVVNYKLYKEDLDVDSLIYSLENKSEHPLSKAIVSYFKNKKVTSLEVSDFNALVGRGVEGIINNKKVYIGNSKYLEDNSIDNSLVLNDINELSIKGETVLIIVIDKVIYGLISLKDQIKPNSVKAIALLKKMGLDVVMLTGDNKLTAEAIGKEVGITNIISEVYPVDKNNVINSLKKDNSHLVAMVGDGVNDALALESSDVGISLGSGSDIALDSSDIVLVRNDLMDVINVIKLSKRTLFTIKLGLFWAFFYNLVCVGLATGFMYYLTNGEFKMTPMIGSLAMSLSSVSVVLNALTINLFKVERNNEVCNIKNDKKEINDMEELVLNIEGMMCMHCVKHVTDALNKGTGVKEVNVSLENKNALIKGNSLNKEELVSLVKEAGYEVK